jgi:hypothetical protein
MPRRCEIGLFKRFEVSDVDSWAQVDRLHLIYDPIDGVERAS